MLYDIKLGINYLFQTPAAGARQILHAMPLTLPGRQRLIAGSIDIDPAPAMRRERQDFFGNRLTEIAFAEPHSKRLGSWWVAPSNWLGMTISR